MTLFGTIEFEQGWAVIQQGIRKLENILEGLPEPPFTAAEYMKLYEVVYNMCIKEPPPDYCSLLYKKYTETYEEYLKYMVLPSLRTMHGELMLREFVRRWSNHKEMVHWLSRFFNFLNRYFIPRKGLPTLNEVGFSCFRNLVYNEFYAGARDAVTSLIDQEREGKPIDQSLLKKAVDIFIEIGMGEMEYYENDFEAAMLTGTTAYYSRKASNWILEDSHPDYMLKADECLKRERERVFRYLHSSSEPKLQKALAEAFKIFDNEGVAGNSSDAYGLTLDLQYKFKEINLASG